MFIFEEIGHESVRIYYHRVEVIKPPKRRRSLIAIDETKIKLENRQIFVWSARDAETGECLFIWALENRSFEAYVFLREVLKYCENKPELLVSKADNLVNEVD